MGLRATAIAREIPTATFVIAESVGFEPTVSLHPHLISNQAPSATRTALHRGNWRNFADESSAVTVS